MMASRAADSGATARAARARELKTSTPAAAGLLGFYASLVEYQQRLADQLVQGSDPLVWHGGQTPWHGGQTPDGFSLTSGSLLQAIDAGWVGGAVREFVLWLVRLKPDPSYETMREVTEAEWRELFESYRASPDEAAARFSEAALFALEAVLQPIAEQLAAQIARNEHSSSSRCPACGRAPAVGVLREAGHGARRRLVCGLCVTEWDYLRVVCVKCGEQRFDALPVFSAEQFPHARIDACDTCRSYLKTIDATKDGRASPLVDDLATVALDLWARAQGYTRVSAGVLRI